MSARNSAVLFTILLLLASVTTLAGCDTGPSPATRAAILRAEQDRIKAEQERDAERQRRQDEQKKHDSEKAQLWMYVVCVAGLAVILLFVGTAIGSAARKDAEQERQKNDNGTSDTG